MTVFPKGRMKQFRDCNPGEVLRGPDGLHGICIESTDKKVKFLLDLREGQPPRVNAQSDDRPFFASEYRYEISTDWSDLLVDESDHWRTPGTLMLAGERWIICADRGYQLRMHFDDLWIDLGDHIVSADPPTTLGMLFCRKWKVEIVEPSDLFRRTHLYDFNGEGIK